MIALLLFLALLVPAARPWGFFAKRSAASSWGAQHRRAQDVLLRNAGMGFGGGDPGLGLGSSQKISIATDGVEKMRVIMQAMLEADEEQILAVMGENVRFLLDPKTPERFKKARSYYPHVADDELDDVFTAIIDFLEEFVNTTAGVERSYQEMVRALIEAAKEGDDAFNAKINSFGAALNFQFLQYLDGEMERMSKIEEAASGVPTTDENAPNIALLRMLRVRVNATLDEAFGPYFAELTRILAIEDDAVRQRAFLSSSTLDGSAEEGEDVKGGLVKLLKYIKAEMEEGKDDGASTVDKAVLLKRINDMLELAETIRDV